MKTKRNMTPHQVSVSAESYTATVLSWAGFDVSVQYGANQPEYDLIAANDKYMVKVSVKGSQDGAWGLAQSYIKEGNYYEAIDIWVHKHNNNTIVSLVQFENVKLENGETPRIYFATPREIGMYMKGSRNGFGHAAVREKHLWKTGVAEGTRDVIPSQWKFSKKRIEELIEECAR